MRKLVLAVTAAMLFGPVVGVLAPVAHDVNGPAVMLAAQIAMENQTPAPVLVKEFPAQAPADRRSPPVRLTKSLACAPAGTPPPASQPSPSQRSPVTVPSPTANGPWKLVWST